MSSVRLCRSSRTFRWPPTLVSFRRVYWIDLVELSVKIMQYLPIIRTIESLQTRLFQLSAEDIPIRSMLRAQDVSQKTLGISPSA